MLHPNPHHHLGLLTKDPQLCDCCADGDARCFCAQATVAPCVAYGTNYSHAVHGPNASGGGCAPCCAPCCAHCMLDAALPVGIQLGSGPSFLQVPVGGFMLRAQQRAAIIEGESCPLACCIELFCAPCSLTQVHRTLRAQMPFPGPGSSTPIYVPSVAVLGLVKRPYTHFADAGEPPLYPPPPNINNTMESQQYY